MIWIRVLTGVSGGTVRLCLTTSLISLTAYRHTPVWLSLVVKPTSRGFEPLMIWIRMFTGVSGGTVRLCLTTSLISLTAYRHTPVWLSLVVKPTSRGFEPLMIWIRVLTGVSGGTRTHYPQFRKLLLYPDELRRH